MSRRARYDGPYPEVEVRDPSTFELLDTVKRGGLLSKEVAASVRDDLLSREDWSEVADPSGSSSSSSATSSSSSATARKE